MSEVHNVPGNGGGPLRIESGSVSTGSLRHASTHAGKNGQPRERLLHGTTLPTTFTDDPHLVMIDRPDSPLAERYRRIRVSLENATYDFPIQPQVIVITSAIPGEGKTTTATNLALAYAEERKHRTLLIGADLRGPAVSRYLSPKPAFGLSGILAGTTLVDDVLIEMAGSKLWVLPEGAPSERPLGIVRGENLGRLIEELRRRFDRIVIDTPPTVPFTDAAILARHADATLLVVRARTTTKTLIRRAWESLSGTNVLGIVLNDVEFSAIDRYYNKYDDYEPGRYAYGAMNLDPARGSRRDRSSS
jgi:capsular exopolysaccharide synthesis family protein